MIFRCSGHKTCLMDCKCKVFHSAHLEEDGHYCCDMTRGSCWHNNHTDGQYHEAFDELVTIEELKKYKKN